MFSNGKFKNVVAEKDVLKTIPPTVSFQETYSLLPKQCMYIFFKDKVLITII